MKKILIVNSDVDTLSLLKDWLEKKDYEIKFKIEEGNVHKMINEYSPDLLLIDVLHAQLLEELKSMIKSKEIPVILMTGNIIIDQQKFIDMADERLKKRLISFLRKQDSSFVFVLNTA
jgi:DNA-binding NtrC family response regulator